tara:strand:+ start:8474 stop:8605 length:132 start_codon:yes stop_codon:yes gene_type:complete
MIIDEFMMMPSAFSFCCECCYWLSSDHELVVNASVLGFDVVDD